MDERVQPALARDRTIDITTGAGKADSSVAQRSGSVISMGRCISRGLRVAVTGMPTYWRTLSSPFISSRA
jgi:hypothetical protein